MDKCNSTTIKSSSSSVVCGPTIITLTILLLLYHTCLSLHYQLLGLLFLTDGHKFLNIFIFISEQAVHLKVRQIPAPASLHKCWLGRREKVSSPWLDQKSNPQQSLSLDYQHCVLTTVPRPMSCIWSNINDIYSGTAYPYANTVHTTTLQSSAWISGWIMNQISDDPGPKAYLCDHVTKQCMNQAMAE